MTYLCFISLQLDAKKSPLALLAQTCSAIGKDPAPSKTSSSGEKKEGRDGRESAGSKAESPQAKSTSPDDTKTDRGNGTSEKRDTSSPSSDKSGFRAPAPKDIPPLVPIPGAGDRSPPPTSGDSAKEGREEGTRSSSVPASSSSSVSSSRLGLSTSMLLDSTAQSELSKSSLSSTVPPSLNGLKADHLGAALPPSLYPGCGLPYLGHPLHGMEAGAPVPPSALSAHSALLASQHKYSMAGHLPGAPGISPYTYARVKTTAGATTLVPICRDPYCTNCQITMQSAQLTSACAAGCTQCSHEKAPTFNGLSSSLSGLSSTVPVVSLAGASGLPATAHLSSLYGHAFGVLPGHPSLPNVCNWMSGSEYCGKRFSSSEELLAHVRTHASSSDTSVLAPGLSAYGLPGLSPAALAAAHNPHYPASLSPNSLRQGYPRSLSPSSLLAARYHPYKSPLSVLPPPSALSGLPTGLPPYYSPYALYSQRLGAAVAPWASGLL